MSRIIRDVDDAVGEGAGYAPGGLDREGGLARRRPCRRWPRPRRGGSLAAKGGGDEVGDLRLAAGEVGDAAGRGCTGKAAGARAAGRRAARRQRVEELVEGERRCRRHPAMRYWMRPDGATRRATAVEAASGSARFPGTVAPAPLADDARSRPAPSVATLVAESRQNASQASSRRSISAFQSWPVFRRLVDEHLGPVAAQPLGDASRASSASAGSAWA